MLWSDLALAGTPYQRGLDGQLPGKHPDALHLLSSLLARHAHSAWGDAYTAYAEIGFPLGRNAPNRVMRLRGYGNAINAEAATAWIESYMTEAADPLVPDDAIFTTTTLETAA